jgi:hypothetical protein
VVSAVISPRQTNKLLARPLSAADCVRVSVRERAPVEGLKHPITLNGGLPTDATVQGNLASGT